LHTLLGTSPSTSSKSDRSTRWQTLEVAGPAAHGTAFADLLTTLGFFPLEHQAPLARRSDDELGRVASVDGVRGRSALEVGLGRRAMEATSVGLMSSTANRRSSTWVEIGTRVEEGDAVIGVIFSV
jgi:hypothetical protein